MNEIAVYRLIIGAFVIVSTVILLIDWCVFRELNKFKKLLAERDKDNTNKERYIKNLEKTIRAHHRSMDEEKLQNKKLNKFISVLKGEAK